MYMVNKIIVVGLIFAGLTIQAQNSSKYLKTLKQTAGNLYYATPTELKSPQGVKMDIDFTLFYHKDSSNQVLIHTSLKHKKPIDKLQVIQFEGLHPITSRNPKLLFVEQIKGKWHYRYESVISMQEFLTLMQHSAAYTGIKYQLSPQDLLFIPNKRFKEAGGIIYEIMRTEMGL